MTIQETDIPPPNGTHADKTLMWLKICIGTGFGVGFLPKMPGTFGSAIVLLPALFPSTNTTFFFVCLATAAFLLGLWVVPVLETAWGNDPSRVVIDEILGMSLVLATPVVPHSWGWLVLAFMLFRLFDITKPYPINRINARQGAFFVMFDDIIASFYALLTLHGAWLIYQLFENR